jgi:type II secretion system protein G
METNRGFTLIELLIVVAIIAILAAIAVPNFLEAQTRAKIGRVQSELRSFATAIESYRIDHGKYPKSMRGAQGEEIVCLTTPIAYMTTLPRDTFKLQMREQQLKDHSDKQIFDGAIYDYILYKYYPGLPKGSDAPGLKGKNQPFFDCVRMDAVVDTYDASFDWFMFSVGPDLDEEYTYIGTKLPRTLIRRSYDASNGTISSGDIFRASGLIF